ncbi:MAG: DUF3050 domain-containing protein [Bacteriovoracaceae bacterium]|nr:DUF3050 domain-containing protein [Bacteriovoracaceae bacterium]
MNMEIEITQKHDNLSRHPMYERLISLEAIRVFMKYHVFAVWDFMSLLKALQREVTCVNIPWMESDHDSESVRLINEIVIGEESDLDMEGNAISHFSLYKKAMEEVGADTSLITNFTKTFDFESLPIEIREMLVFHLDLAKNGKTHEVASSFFYGREKLIPEMFESIVKVIKKSKLECPNLIYYLERHIELDGEEHGPKAAKFLQTLTKTDIEQHEVLDVARKSLMFRWNLWDFIQKEIQLL